MTSLSWLRLATITALVLSRTALAPPRAAAQAVDVVAPDAGAVTTPARYALVVGTNDGGPGQSRLRYAEDDAGRVADVLTTLGGYPATQVERLLRPTAAELDGALQKLQGALSVHAARGEPSRFFFYYSGHARADALNLGHEQVPLATLRERVLSLPATVSLVVLDACQSGAFSHVKGAEPAADFSFNSVERLNTEGVAVIASSSGVELSQESDALRSGYFTHHFLVALRGAGDDDRDGRVTLSEAYQYAYNRTLATTATTAVGEQHVTLETNFKGKGELDLTRPGDADAHLQLPASFAGRVLVQSLPSWSPLAEVDKARGQSLTLALPAGSYAATLRDGGDVLRCTLPLRSGQVTTLSLDACNRHAAVQAVARGASSGGCQADAGRAADGGDEGLVLELAIGGGEDPADDAYLSRLQTFDFHRQEQDTTRYSVAAGYRLHRYLMAGLWYLKLGGDSFSRESAGVTQDFSFSGDAFGLFAQSDLAIGSQRMFDVFVRVGGGLALASSRFDAIKPNAAFADANASVSDLSTLTEAVEQHHASPFVAFGGGLQINPFENLGFLLEARYVLAPVLANELGETHDLGGVSILIGLRLRTWGWP